MNGSKGHCPWWGSKGQSPLVGVRGETPTLAHANTASHRAASRATLAGAVPPRLVREATDASTVSTENTYDDGKGTKWDFKDRNSFFGPFDYRGE